MEETEMVDDTIMSDPEYGAHEETLSLEDEEIAGAEEMPEEDFDTPLSELKLPEEVIEVWTCITRRSALFHTSKRVRSFDKIKGTVTSTLLFFSFCVLGCHARQQTILSIR